MRSSLSDLAPSVNFPVTICVLCYGPNASLARRFLNSLYGTTDPSLFLLRAGLNEAEAATHRLFAEFSRKFKNIDLYIEPANVFKNPMMRRLFHEKRICSQWTLWCDDDTHFTRPDWLQGLALKIESSPETSMWGSTHRICVLEKSTWYWIRKASWFRRVPFRRGTDRYGNKGVDIYFANGAFWAIRTELLYQLDWPDRRLRIGAEDFILGEALRQNGHRIGNFHHGVAVNDAPRRNPGAHEHTHILNDF